MIIYCTNKEKFYKYILLDKVFVLFTANWCKFCKKFNPIFEKYAKNNEEELFLIIEIENKNEIADEQQIKFIPIFRHYSNGKIVKELNDYSEEGMTQFGKIK